MTSSTVIPAESVIPAQAGIQTAGLDTRLHGCDVSAGVIPAETVIPAQAGIQTGWTPVFMGVTYAGVIPQRASFPRRRESRLRGWTPVYTGVT